MSNTDSLSVGIKQAFIRLITKHTGLEIRERDQVTLSEKIFLRMKALQLSFPEDYYKILEAPTFESHQEWEKLVVLITNLESYFFRDKELFNLLQTNLLPELINRKKDNKTLRICSAGCSTGEEPYSLAILLKELLPDLEEWNLLILGIDINQEALQKAKEGIYRPWSFRNTSAAIKNRYFQVINNQYHLAPQIKQMLTFESLNLVKEPFPQPNSELRDFDLILCRNVFIYFEASAISKVLDKFYHALQPLGYLITGHAELYGQKLSQFQTKVFPESLVYQRQVDNLVDTPLLYLPSQSNYPSAEYSSLEMNDITLESALEDNNFKMQHAAINLLKQLPPDTKIPKLGNLTAAELIQQLKTTLKLSE